MYPNNQVHTCLIHFYERCLFQDQLKSVPILTLIFAVSKIIKTGGLVWEGTPFHTIDFKKIFKEVNPSRVLVFLYINSDSVWWTMNSLHNWINQEKTITIVYCHSIVLSHVLTPSFGKEPNPCLVGTPCDLCATCRGGWEVAVTTINSPSISNKLWLKVRNKCSHINQRFIVLYLVLTPS